MVRTLPCFVLACVCLLVSEVATRDFIMVDDPGLPDSVLIDSVTVTVPVKGVVPVHFSNDELLDGIEVTLKCSSPDIRIDSFSFAGGRLESLFLVGSIFADGAIVVFGYPGTEGPIPAGRGLLGKAHLSYNADVIEQVASFDTTTAYMADSMVVHSTWFSPTNLPGEFVPRYRRGFLDIQRCCAGLTGNTDCDSEQKMNLADITRLIDAIYLTKAALCCPASGNTDGDTNWKINLSDVTRLIDHIYLSKEPTAPCP